MKANIQTLPNNVTNKVINHTRSEILYLRHSLSLIRLIADSCSKEPPSDIKLVEGQPMELEYKLWNGSLKSTFLKNGIFLPASQNIQKVVDGVCRKLKITNITQKDVGLYCLEVLGYRSNTTDLIIQRMTLILQ